MLLPIPIDLFGFINHVGYGSTLQLINKHQDLFLCDIESEGRMAEQLYDYEDLSKIFKNRRGINDNIKDQDDMRGVMRLFVQG